MSAFLPRFLDVSTPWVMWHNWPAGQKYVDSGQMALHTLWLFLEGEAHVRIGKRHWTLGANSAFLVPPGVIKEVSTPGGAQWYSLAINAHILGQINLLELMRPPALFLPDATEMDALRQAMAGLHREWAGAACTSPVTPDNFDVYIKEHYSLGTPPDSTSSLLLDAYARTLIALCWRRLGTVKLEQAAGQGMPPWVTIVLQELRADPNISIERLAHDIGISPTQLRRQFQKWFGAAPREYLNRLRLDDARQLLESTELPVNDIAEHIGFLSPAHFNRLFKQTFGMPPAQYRQLSRIK